MVIFVTVGSQMPFDRLVVAMDAWAVTCPDHVVTAQIGESGYRPNAMAAVKTLPPARFVERLREADVVVAHAGMGSVICAAEQGKPMVLMPRMGAMRETRNDHQVATAKWLAAKEGVFIAANESFLAVALDDALRYARRSVKPNAEPLVMVRNLRAVLHKLCG